MTPMACKGLIIPKTQKYQIQNIPSIFCLSGAKSKNDNASGQQNFNELGKQKNAIMGFKDKPVLNFDQKWR
jgi:hypothetical protein